MQVQVRHGLPGGGTVVDADVEAGRVELSLELDFCLVEKRKHLRTLERGDVEERRDVAHRDDQRVPWSDRIGIAECDRCIVAEEDAFS